jgi:hypothetical protein
MRRLLRRIPGLGLALSAFVLLTAESIAPTDDEVECESAVSHLGQCCPGFDSQVIKCVEAACTVPDLSASSSQVLEGMDCDAIRAAGLCDASTVEARYGRNDGATP